MDQEKVIRCLHRIAGEGDARSFKELYSHYFSRLLQFSIIIVHSREPAEEIVDDVFINLWRRKEHLFKIENPDVYFYVAVKNKSLDYLSKNHLKETVSLHEISEQFLQFSLDPEQMMITREMRNKIQDAIDQLPPRCKIIFKLIKEDGLKYKEAAAILDLSIKTIEAQLAIATKKLAKAIVMITDRKVHSSIDK